MKRNDFLRFILNNKYLYKIFTSFKWFNALIEKRAREIINGK